MTGAQRYDGPMRSLSPREREIARLIAHGLTNRQIAEELTLSVRTVEGHIYNARTKLDVATRHELARAVWGHRVPRSKQACPDCPFPFLEAEN